MDRSFFGTNRNHLIFSIKKSKKKRKRENCNQNEPPGYERLIQLQEVIEDVEHSNKRKLQRLIRSVKEMADKRKHANRQRRRQMEYDKVLDLMEQAFNDSILEFECPKCGAGIVSEADVEDLYCDECKMIVMQNPLTAMGLI